MDRNTIYGLLIIVAIFIGFSIYSSPSKEEQAKAQHQRDSIAAVNIANAVKAKKDSAVIVKDTIKKVEKDSKVAVAEVSKNDSAVVADKNSKFGVFASSANGVDKEFVLENKLLKVKIAKKGGRITSVQLKKYSRFDGKPLLLMDKDSSRFNFKFFINNAPFETSELYFEPAWNKGKFYNKDSITVSDNDSASFMMRLYPLNADSTKNENSFIEFQYTIKGNSYMMGFNLRFVGMKQIMDERTKDIALDWYSALPVQEKAIKSEQAASTIYYKYVVDNEVDYLSETSDKKEELKGNLKWIAFKQQFFTSVLMADNNFSNAKVATLTNKSSQKFVRDMTAEITIPYDISNTKGIPMKMYFGPTHYKTLRQFDADLERQIPLGWGFFLMQWINRFAVIPVFNFLEGYGLNYGIIILLLTILLKIVLFPIAYKTYLSSAKMRVLKPEIEEINKKIPKEEAMKRQQATMALYKKAGVNPMAGCIPMLLQLPILFSLFRFFPASIELRQQSFLWATDLSTYDSIWTFPNGFNIPFYGDHISLFTILMTISTIIYTKVNNDMMGSTNQMPGMKYMMYLMPIMFLGIFNNYSSGLSYYYFLANMLTFAQMYFIRKFVDEDKIHAQIQENKTKPAKKKSGFQQRLEDMAKAKGYNPPKKK